MTNTTAPTYATPKIAHAIVCQSALAQRAPATGSYQAPMPLALLDEVRSDPGEPHLFAGRRGRAQQEEVARQPIALTRHLLRPRARFRAATTTVSTVGSAKATSSASPGITLISRIDRHREPEDPPGGREHRHVHVVEREDLVAQHGEAIEIVGPFVVLDRRHRSLQPRDVRLEEDRHAVAEAPLRPVADDAQEPRGDGRETEPRRRDHEHRPVAVLDAAGEQREPQREQRVGQRGEHDDRERERAAAARPSSPASPAATSTAGRGQVVT